MNKVYDFLLKELNLKYNDTLIVGVSGGPDSMALLHILVKVKKELDINIVCAHVNHNMRKESASEKKFVEQYCDEVGIIFEWTKFQNYGEDNFHNEARNRRYQYFEDLVKKYNASYLLTAHHADDLMETILMRLVRGSSLKGYAGFSRIVDMEFYKILRPLIYVSKDEILSFNELNKIKYVYDKSNEKDVYTRNRYRKYVLPFLKKEDPNVHEKFFKFSTLLEEYNNYLDNQMKKSINRVYNQRQIDILRFRELDKVIQNKVIDYVLEDIYQDDLMLIYDSHVDLIFQLINSRKVNTFIYLPNNIKVVKAYDLIAFHEQKDPNEKYEVEIINHVNLPDGKNIEITSKDNETSNFVIRINSDELTLPLHVRSRHEGDKMEVKGMIGSQKIKDIFIDKKIPAEERELWPIVIDSKGKIIWVPGLKKSKFDKAKSEKYDIILRYY